jgi:hypothetical protein
MYGVMWEGGDDGPAFADAASIADADQVARALVAAGFKGVAYWHIDGRTSTSAEMDCALMSVGQLELTRVSKP